VLIGAHAEDVAVDAACALGVLRGDADEVELLEECHARQSVNQPQSGSRKAAGAVSMAAGSGFVAAADIAAAHAADASAVERVKPSQPNFARRAKQHSSGAGRYAGDFVRRRLRFAAGDVDHRY
jgi:hypothetical protein